MSRGPGARMARLVVVAAALVALSGCGESRPPGERVPQLRAALAKVDAAVADRDYRKAGDALAELVRRTRDARAAGTLSAAEADRIEAAAARMNADLPKAKLTPTPTPTPSATTTKPPDDDDDDKKGKGKGKGDDD